MRIAAPGACRFTVGFKQNRLAILLAVQHRHAGIILAGAIRPAPRGQERLKEAAQLGFTHALIPKANAPRQAIKGIEVIAVDRVARPSAFGSNASRRLIENRPLP